MSTLGERLKNSIRKRRISWRHFSADIVLLGVSLVASLYLRLGFLGVPEYIEDFKKLVLIFLLIKVVFLIHFKVYTAIWRYFSSIDVVNLLKANTAALIASATISYFLVYWAKLPRSFVFIDFVVSTAFLVGIRFFRRMLFEYFHKNLQNSSQLKYKALIYGSDVQIKNILQNAYFTSQCEPVGILMDDRATWNRIYNRVPVLGDLATLDTLLRNRFANQVVIAQQGSNPEQIKKVFDICRPYNIRPLINSAQNYVMGAVDTVRTVNLEDLLPRQSNDIDVSLVQSLIKGKNVLVTGAGGSIGSELSRQILKYEPHTLVLLDHSEYSLYEIDSELRSPQFRDKNIVPALCDIKNKALLDHVFKKNNIQVVFHAAAYKHVHLVEDNVTSAIANNVLGTMNLLELSKDAQVERFVLISTDKAVNPVGVMGASKRLCELLTTLYAKESALNFSSVRFGNVLGSSGSLIPLIKGQIEHNQPVTVTHPDITRYFMLIPEAVSLVLMSSVISKAGDINVLKMGQPVKILDVVKALIALMNKSESETPIVFTGLRPGEKMYEELYLSGKEIQTNHPDILTLPSGDASTTQTISSIRGMLENILHKDWDDAQIKTELMALIR
jgi:FlaA1/EpsC-like NDP-sugar epimerase